ncbi:5318_t:CDS:2, partial [Dentiscutata erythropus]
MVSDINPLLLKSRLLEERNERWYKIKKNKYDSIQEEIQTLLLTPIPLQALFGFQKKPSKLSTTSDKSVSISHLSTFFTFYKYEIPSNTAAQKVANNKIKNSKAKIIEFESLFNLATDIKCGKYFSTLNFIQKYKLQHSNNRKYQDSNLNLSLSNSAMYENFVYSQELCKEIEFKRSFSD